ncbi:MAG: hypothetical protein JXA77_13850 [Bacteroidales bacterium]|nr:hypothetical protein [Bacteroidales bacterium]MBN2819186.1 hypothetical protein [Bacteroidales bacterium]
MKRLTLQLENKILLLLIICLASCNTKKDNIEPLEVSIKVVRFEKILFESDIYAIKDSVVSFQARYPEFLSLYGNRIIEIGDPQEEWFDEALTAFTTDQAIYEIYKRVVDVFPDIDIQTREIENAFGRIKAVFPDKKIPNLFTYVSGLNQSVAITEKFIGISLEKFLGENDPLYNQVYPPIAQYQKTLMTPGRISLDVMRGWISSEFDYQPEQDNLLSRIIFEGRTMYLLQKLFPEVADSVLWGFEKSKLDFCFDNEKQMWTYLIENKLLFITDNFRIMQFTAEAPFTKDFQDDSPGRAGVWLGYRIVEQYMNSNNDVSLNDLMHETNYQKILNNSKYNP